MVPNVKENYENINLELIFRFVQLDKDPLTIKTDYYKFWNHNLPSYEHIKK